MLRHLLFFFAIGNDPFDLIWSICVGAGDMD